MGVRGSRRARHGPLLRLAFRTGADARLATIGIVIASVSEAIQGNAGPPTTSGSPRRPVGLLTMTIQIRLASAVAGRPSIDARIAAGRGDPQSAKIVRPTLGMSLAFVGVRKSGMGHAHKRAAVPLQKIDLDQA